MISKFKKQPKVHSLSYVHIFILGAKPILNGLLDVVNIDFKVDTSDAC